MCHTRPPVCHTVLEHRHAGRPQRPLTEALRLRMFGSVPFVLKL